MKLLSQLRLSAIILIAVLSSASAGFAQKTDTVSTFSITGYIDAYYAYYTDSVGPGNFQKFPTASPRSLSPGLNTAQVAFQYTAEKVRATGIFHYGDIAASTWAGQFNNINEAHVGLKVFSKLWIDAGFFRTHFGTELLTPAENITSSVTVGTFHEPYYQSGIRFNFDPTSKLQINVFLLNGYNVFTDNNNKKSAGASVTYAINSDLGIGYSNYIGDDSHSADSISHTRIAQNLYFNYTHNKIKLQIGGDYFMQQNSDVATGKASASMFSALATVRYQCATRMGIYARGEVFQDPDGYVGGVFADKKANPTGYKLWGATLGAEFKPTPESYIKLEGRMLQMDADQEVFYSSGTPQSSRFEIMINAGVTFDLLRRFGTRSSE